MIKLTYSIQLMEKTKISKDGLRYSFFLLTNLSQSVKLQTLVKGAGLLLE